MPSAGYIRLMAEAEMTACFSGRRSSSGRAARDTTRPTSRSGTGRSSGPAAGACGRPRTGSSRRRRRGRRPATGYVAKLGLRCSPSVTTGEPVASKRRTCRARHRRTGRRAPPRLIVAGGRRLHAVDQRLGPGDAADGFSGECHGSMLIDRPEAGRTPYLRGPRNGMQEETPRMARDDERLSDRRKTRSSVDCPTSRGSSRRSG